MTVWLCMTIMHDFTLSYKKGDGFIVECVLTSYTAYYPQYNIYLREIVEVPVDG